LYVAHPADGVRQPDIIHRVEGSWIW
jgi:hypothetical protein